MKQADLGGRVEAGTVSVPPVVPGLWFPRVWTGVYEDACTPGRVLQPPYPKPKPLYSSLPFLHRWGVLLVGLERAWHVWGWLRSQRLRPEAHAGSAVVIRTPCGLWSWPLPGPLPPASPPYTGPAPRGHWLFPRCHRGRQISGSCGQREKVGRKTSRNLYPKPI